jgi:transposase
MWMIPESLKIFIATSPTDMRKSFDGLSNLVYSVIEMDPLSGHLFVFFNRSRDRIKILWSHNGGFNLFCGVWSGGDLVLPSYFRPDVLRSDRDGKNRPI